MKQIQIQLYPPERPHWHGDIKKHWRSSGIFIVNFEKIPLFFLVFALLNLGKCFRLRLPTEIKVQTIKNYKTCKHRHKVCHINQTGQTTTLKETCFETYLKSKSMDWFLYHIGLRHERVKSMQIAGFEQTSTKFIKIIVL